MSHVPARPPALASFAPPVAAPDGLESEGGELKRSERQDVAPPREQPAGRASSAAQHEARNLLGVEHVAADVRGRLETWWASRLRNRPPNTTRAMRADLAVWLAWCRRFRQPALPAFPSAVASFLRWYGPLADGARGPEERSPATLARYLATIAKVHGAAGLPDPTKDALVREELAGIRRKVAHRREAPRQAAGLTADVVECLVAGFGTTPRDLRDRALLLTARDLLARRSELAAARWGDLRAAPTGPGAGLLTIHYRKTDQQGKGTVAYLGPATWAALQAWRDALGAARPKCVGPDAAVFWNLGKTGVPRTALSAQAVARIIRRRVTEAVLRDPALAALLEARGLAPEDFSGHSARVGMAQDLAATGADLPGIMQAGGWTSPTQVARYVAHISATQGAVARFHGARHPRSDGRGAR